MNSYLKDFHRLLSGYFKETGVILGEHILVQINIDTDTLLFAPAEIKSIKNKTVTIKKKLDSGTNIFGMEPQKIVLSFYGNFEVYDFPIARFGNDLFLLRSASEVVSLLQLIKSGLKT